MSVSDGSRPGVSSLPYQICGRGPTATIKVARNVGMLVLRRYTSFSAPLCRDHGFEIARNWLLATLLMGWWGLISFVTNFAAIATDLRALRAARGLAPAGSVIASPSFEAARLQSPEPLPRVSRARMGLTLAGILVVVIVGPVAATFGPKSISRLAVGDCFDAPTASTDISDVPNRPCSSSHTAEVFDIVSFPEGRGATYPTSDVFKTFVSTQCGPAFDTYTGGGTGVAATVDIGYLVPTERGWYDDEDRTVICYIEAGSGQTLSTSLRSSP